MKSPSIFLIINFKDKNKGFRVSLWHSGVMKGFEIEEEKNDLKCFGSISKE